LRSAEVNLVLVVGTLNIRGLSDVLYSSWIKNNVVSQPMRKTNTRGSFHNNRVINVQLRGVFFDLINKYGNKHPYY
jgi:hypothetical protein